MSALMIASFLLLFAFTITNLAVFHYQSAQHEEEILQAREAAQSGLSETVRRLSTDPTFGSAGQVVTGTVGTANYTVTFVNTADRHSTNNLGGFSAVAGWGGRTVPAHTAHVLSTGLSRTGQSRTVEAIVQLEALPFPLQSTDQVVDNTDVVTAAASLADYQAGHPALPGAIYSGGNVSLSGVGSVSGDVRAVGTSSIAPTVAVAGQVKNNAAPLQVPNLNIASFDSSSTPGVTVLSGGTYNALTSPIGGIPGIHHLTGTIYVDSSIHLIGPVQLDQASIFVAGGGNFTVDGPLLGQGSLFVTGETHLTAGALLRNDQQIAVFSQKNLDVTAAGIFQGVLYSHGNITTGPGVTVLGAIIGQSDNPGEAAVQLGLGGTVVHLPEYTAFASYWLAQGGGAPARLDYWGELP